MVASNQECDCVTVDEGFELFVVYNGGIGIIAPQDFPVVVFGERLLGLDLLPVYVCSCQRKE